MRYIEKLDGEEWGVWDTQQDNWVTFGRYNPGGSLSRWTTSAAASRAAQRMNTGTPSEIKQYLRQGLP